MTNMEATPGLPANTRFQACQTKLLNLMWAMQLERMLDGTDEGPIHDKPEGFYQNENQEKTFNFRGNLYGICATCITAKTHYGWAG